MKHACWVVVGILFAVAGCQTINQDAGSDKARVEVVIGTGGQGGVYLPTGNNICQMVHKERKRHGIDCFARETRGSVANLNNMRAGSIQMAMAQSDWHFHAYNGTSKFRSAGPDKDLRSVFSLYPEPVTLIARPGTGIRSIRDLKGKAVNIGRPGTGTEAYWDMVWKALGNSNDDLKRATHMSPNDAGRALCAESIDAAFWIVGNPNSMTYTADKSCGARVVEVADPAIKKLIADNSFLRHGLVPARYYPSTPKDVKTFGVGLTFLTTKAMSEEVVYEIVKAVFENFGEFKNSHRVYLTLRKEEMVKASLTAPLHRGAVKYYKEAGLM